MGLEGSKSPKYDPKLMFLGFWQKSYPFRYYFLLQHEITNGLSTFCKSNMFGKNIVLDLWSKNPKIDHNAGFFKLQYHTNKLRYKVKFLDVTRVP